MPPEGFQAAQNLFIRRWGEMGASWGISRTMAEIHALLYLSPEPLCTDDIMANLEVSRGNASMNIRQLVHWGLIERVHRRGDRKEYFEAEHDVYQMFETITRERRRREVEPILETIERCCSMIKTDKVKLKADVRKEATACLKRLQDMLEFFDVMNHVFNAFAKVGPEGFKQLTAILAELDETS